MNNIDDSFLTDEINRRATLFCVDNPKFANELTAITTAMQIGASVVFEDIARMHNEELATVEALVEPEVAADNILQVLFSDKK